MRKLLAGGALLLLLAGCGDFEWLPADTNNGATTVTNSRSAGTYISSFDASGTADVIHPYRIYTSYADPSLNAHGFEADTAMPNNCAEGDPITYNETVSRGVVIGRFLSGCYPTQTLAIFNSYSSAIQR